MKTERIIYIAIGIVLVASLLLSGASAAQKSNQQLYDGLVMLWHRLDRIERKIDAIEITAQECRCEIPYMDTEGVSAFVALKILKDGVMTQTVGTVDEYGKVTPVE